MMRKDVTRYKICILDRATPKVRSGTHLRIYFIFLGLYLEVPLTLPSSFEKPLNGMLSFRFEASRRATAIISLLCSATCIFYVLRGRCTTLLLLEILLHLQGPVSDRDANSIPLAWLMLSHNLPSCFPLLTRGSHSRCLLTVSLAL